MAAELAKQQVAAESKRAQPGSPEALEQAEWSPSAWVPVLVPLAAGLAAEYTLTQHQVAADQVLVAEEPVAADRPAYGFLSILRLMIMLMITNAQIIAKCLKAVFSNSVLGRAGRQASRFSAPDSHALRGCASRIMYKLRHFVLAWAYDNNEN